MHGKLLLVQNLFVGFSLLLWSACSSDLLDDGAPEGEVDSNLEHQVQRDALPDSTASGSTSDMDTVSLEEILNETDDYVPARLPNLHDYSYWIECVRSPLKICTVLQTFDYILFGKIVNLAPVELSETEREEMLSQCSSLHHRALIITLEVYEDLKKEKPLEESHVEVYISNGGVRNFEPQLAFNSDDQLVWGHGEDRLREGDVIGVFGSREPSTQYILGSPLISLEKKNDEWTMNVQEEVTCWKDNEFHGIGLTTLRTRINKCKAAGLYENQSSARPLTNFYECTEPN